MPNTHIKRKRERETRHEGSIGEKNRSCSKWRSHGNHNTSPSKWKILRLYNCIDLPHRRVRNALLHNDRTQFECTIFFVDELRQHIWRNSFVVFSKRSRNGTMFTCFVVFWLFAVVYGISMCRYSPSPDCTVAHSHRPGHRQCESMLSVEHWHLLLLMLLLRHQNYNYYCCFDCCCYAIASAE